MEVNNELRKYIENNIFPLYENNYIGDGIDRVYYVIKRSEQIIEENDLNVDDNILFAVISYHDLRKNNDEKSHEKVSSEIMFNDEFLKDFFTEKQREIIKEAIEDQRAKLEDKPRNIYGKILSSADRKVEVKQYLLASMSFNKKKNPRIDKYENIETSYNFAIKKFGKNGYAVNKSYVEDLKYKKFLEDIQYLIENKDIFVKLADIVYDEL
jgi:hypothetical protein